jgi:hypothetical protein
MSRITFPRRRRGRHLRRIVALLAVALLCLTMAAMFAAAALAESEGETIITPGGAEITTSKGMEAPELDYTFVWWTFILTFGLLAVYYFVVLRISNTEFKKIIDAHFGPKQGGGD